VCVNNVKEPKQKGEKIMKILQQREGRTQIEVLSVIVNFQYEQDINPRITDITKRLPLTKGAVSNNCQKLLKQNLVVEIDKRYSLNEPTFIDAYKEHLEHYFIREPLVNKFKEKIEEQNEIRTETKNKLNNWLSDSDNKQFFLNILLQALKATNKTSLIQTLREVFLYADIIVLRLNTYLDEKNQFKEIIKNLAVCMDHQHEELSNIIKDKYGEKQ
jgi:hypothetical protein